MAFKEKERFYTIDGVQYPPVTSILALKDKSGPLMGWAVKMGAEAVREYFHTVEFLENIDEEKVYGLIKNAFRAKQDTALGIGSKTHNAIEVFTKASTPQAGLKLVTSLPEYPEIETPFGAFLEWHKEVSFVLVRGEHQVCSKAHRYAGTLDAIARVRGLNTLVDYKSSTGMREEYLWQISAYDRAYNEMPCSIPVESWGCLRLDKVTGKPEWKEWTIQELDRAFAKFKCLLDLWWLMKEDKKEKKDGKL